MEGISEVQGKRKETHDKRPFWMPARLAARSSML
jgi:hypothetical protein